MEIGAGAEEAGVAFAVFLGAVREPIDDLRLSHLARHGEIAVEAESAGMGEKSSSMERTPIAFSMASRSEGDLGRYLIGT